MKDYKKWKKEHASYMYKIYMEKTMGIKIKNYPLSINESLILFLKKDIAVWSLRQDTNNLGREEGVWTPLSYRRKKAEQIRHGVSYNYSEYCTNKPATIKSKDGLVEICSNGCITKININPIQYADAKYEHIQSVASNIWNIEHNLGFNPNVYVINEEGIEVEGVITIINNNEMRIEFSSPTKGKAYLS